MDIFVIWRRKLDTIVVALPLDHIHDQFIYDVDRLYSLGVTRPRTKPIRHDMAAILRKLVLDRRLAENVAKNFTTPLLVIVPEPISGNPRKEATESIPENVMRYAPEISDRTHPGGLEGYFHCPYPLREFLERPQVVLPLPNELKGRPITSRELISLMSDKLGGVHLEPEIKDSSGKKAIASETLYLINKSVSIFGEEALYQTFDVVAEMLWRSLAPLKDEVWAARKESGA